MKSFLLTTALLFGLSSSALAQPQLSNDMGRDGEVVHQPICSKLVNRSGVTIQGTVMTQKQVLKNGQEQQFSDNFKLSPNQFREICSSGPFFQGRKIDLTIRTLIPLFNCKTQLGRTIYLDMEEDSEGIKRYSATCY